MMIPEMRSFANGTATTDATVADTPAREDTTGVEISPVAYTVLVD